MEKDWYEVLGVPRHAEAAEIKAAYRALVLRAHPDLNAGDPRAGALFMNIHAAYEVLGNPYRRALYDRARASPGPGAGPPAKTAAARGRGARLPMLFGALLALYGFAGVFLAPRDGLPASWLLPGIGREESFRLCLAGTAMVFFAAGLRRLRRD
ncbi:MAG: DnaJ domain-containing protein [Elusimicrobia bacterium]|nr:DnaJ domain-containing protein [Elusimicrobiota bacterium]